MKNNDILFKKRFRGYRADEVDRYIEKLTDEYNKSVGQGQMLENEVQKLAHQNDGLTRLNDELTRQNNELIQKCAGLEADFAALQTGAAQAGEKDTLAQNIRMQAIGQALVDAKAYAIGKAEAVNEEAELTIRKAQREAEQIRIKAQTEVKDAYAKRDEVINSLHRTLASILPEEKSVLPEEKAGDASDTKHPFNPGLPKALRREG